MGEAMAKTELNPYVCEHCIERGPNLATAVPDMEALKKRPVPPEFTPPEGWTPKPSPRTNCLRNRRLTF
jgi:hypothetical protein